MFSVVVRRFTKFIKNYGLSLTPGFVVTVINVLEIFHFECVARHVTPLLAGNIIDGSTPIRSVTLCMTQCGSKREGRWAKSTETRKKKGTLSNQLN
jgi:hypothetical protein